MSGLPNNMIVKLWRDVIYDENHDESKDWENPCEPQREEKPSEVIEMLEDRNMSNAINMVLDTLNEREKKVILMRFGIKYGMPRTLKNISKIFGVTRERIRQVESKALKKLSQPMRSRQIEEFWEQLAV